MKRAFTLLELIVVIIILGILATLGFTQYSKQVESTRLAEAKVIIGSMRQLTTEYYWKNGSLDGIANADVGVDNTCASGNYYRYSITGSYVGAVNLKAIRCTSGGKTPNYSSAYVFWMRFVPSSGLSVFLCASTDGASDGCFGYPGSE